MNDKISILTDENDRIINVNNGVKESDNFQIVDKKEYEEAFDVELEEDEKLIKFYDGDEFYHQIEKVERDDELEM